MHFRKSFFLLSFFFLFSVLLESEEQNKSVISARTLSLLKEKGSISRSVVNEGEMVPAFCPDTPLSKKAVQEWNRENNDAPGLLLEKLYIIDKTSLIKKSGKGKATDISVTAVSRIVRSVSKMQGMQYYSNGDQKWETLYLQSYLIDSPQRKQRIADKIDGSSDGLQLYCLQEDNSFGTCIYRLNYSETGGEVSACFTNVESLKYGVITAVKNHNLKINLVVIDQNEYYLVYMLVQTKYLSLPLLDSRLNRSFNARIDAIYKWFLNQF
jgi:hypothetical protein